MVRIPAIDTQQFHWHEARGISNRAFVCGFCSTKISSNLGYQVAKNQGNAPQGWGLYICPNCQGVSFITNDGVQFPEPAIGSSVSSVPNDLNDLYEEARRCTTSGCYTAAVLLCRKMLMNIAVTQGATQGEPFIHYVNYLAARGYVPPNGKLWVDHIRTKGNEATHEIALMKMSDAKELLTFIEMLLRFIYEFPAMVPKSTGSA